jgi:type VI secretion system protein ImpI
MGIGLALRIQDAATGEVVSRRFEGPSILFGRDAEMCGYALADGHVSKLHANVEFRDGQLFVQDARSTNGTFVKGQRIQPHTWVRLGDGMQEQEIVIAKWRISVRAEYLSAAPNALSLSLAALTTDPPPANAAATSTYAMAHPLDAVTGLYAQHLALLSRLHAELRRNLEAAPPTARQFIAVEAVRRFPVLLNNVDFHVLFSHYRGSPPLTPDRAALIAIQELSRVHVDSERPLTSPQDIASFTANLSAAIDTLVSGTTQLFSGMREFEHQMELDEEKSGNQDVPSSRRPRSPQGLARALLDWRLPTESAHDMLRRRFSALMVHQVAMLNGVMRGVKVLLTELAPKTIEKMLARAEGRGGKWRRFMGWFFRPRALWSLFSERYTDLADEENERFRILFGPEFASEYRQFTRESPQLRPSTRSSGPPRDV